MIGDFNLPDVDWMAGNSSAKHRSLIETAEELQAGALREDVSEDYFLEGLINNIRNETISHQLFICKYLKKVVPNCWTK